MVLENLIDSIYHIEGDVDVYYLLIATRTIDNILLEEGIVQYRNISHIENDKENKKLTFVPSALCCSQEQAVGFTIKDLNDFCSNNLNEINTYELRFVDRKYEKNDGGKVVLSGPIVGSYVHHKNQAIWLLEGPEEQWQQSS